MNTNNIATFQKVSFEEYFKARSKMLLANPEEVKDQIFEEWKNIKLPQRSTSGAAGYDFHIPFSSDLTNQSKLIPTGIRANIEDGWVLMLYPRSGFGTKFGMKLSNTVGIIDSDYYHADNEGHIMAMVSTDMPLLVTKGERFIQGVFVPYGTASNGNTEAARRGGFGSTGTK